MKKRILCGVTILVAAGLVLGGCGKKVVRHTDGKPMWPSSGATRARLRADPAPRCRLEGCRTTGPGMTAHHPACPAAKREGGGA